MAKEKNTPSDFLEFPDVIETGLRDFTISRLKWFTKLEEKIVNIDRQMILILN
jgi:hypothetical protein